jgi:hypothetical protein
MKYTVSDIARMTGLTKVWIARKCARGQVPGAKKVIDERGSYWVIPKSGLKAFASYL